ncbi:pullulanase [Mycoplasma sp. NEAQ87857]|uniref:alpha-amylase family glycosyl hydrolase n=1 Tax=Mycoplasma sp. NEAQ87857 TaxID=2683967 RepID=UPI0013165018|nr:alpha-amylase family glycosyl hydrolase [Mycoplasma sp. NEAQ87857]QGZ97221.1 pullulanase [Mycoplasma sp. NEAQ87857]
MNLYKESNEFFKDFDKKYSYSKNDLGVIFKDQKIQFKLWQPLALKVELLIFDKVDQSKLVKTFLMEKDNNVWTCLIDSDYESYYYQYQITHPNHKKTIALDPYAKSMAMFNWEGKETKVAKGAIVNIKSVKAGKKPMDLVSNLNTGVDPLIYELHIRDFTSLSNKQLESKKGTFNAAIESDIFGYLNDLGVSHLQLLPIHSTYTVNEFDTNIYNKGQGSKWTTNYNWGYDPHNYFTINGIYSSNPQDPYARIKEFKEFVDKAHKNNIAVILDVVYNHMMTNTIFNNILRGYYYRDNAKVKPVAEAPLADNRKMVQKLIIDSLTYFVKEFNVDGFRFDLSGFLTKKTINQIAKKLRKIKPNITLHGETWNFSDLKPKDAYIKGYKGNDISFGYFNDSIRNAIKGSDHSSDAGLMVKYSSKYFKTYVSSIVGNIRDYDFGDFAHSKAKYDLFANDVKINLAYSHCHDGMTLWDKLNTSSKNLSFIQRLERYRQAMMMSVLTQGRQLMLAGTELLQSKPNDVSGMDAHRAIKSNYTDVFNENADDNSYQSNSYKTTDYVNGLKWDHLNNDDVHKYIYQFTKQLNHYRQSNSLLRLNSNDEIKQCLEFITVDSKQGIIVFRLKNKDKTIEIAHNFSNKDYEYDFNNKTIILHSKINYNNKLEAHSSILMELKK